MCPPTEMPLTVNENARLITINVKAWPAMLPVASYSMIRSAPRIPKIRARCADGDSCRGGDQCAGRAGETRDEVERQIADVPEVALDGRAEPPHREHVQPDVKEVRVQEGSGNKSPPVTVRHGRPVEDPLREEAAAR